MRASGFILAVFLAIQAASGGTISYTGTLASPDDASTVITVTLASGGTLGLETYGFGGGTNAASEAIAAGGFDPFVGVFAGTGNGALFIDGTSDLLSNYSPGCPPAGMVNIGGAVCGDVALSETLAAGTYTVLLTDGAYIPNAIYETNGTLGDGFNDLTGGAFQTCNTTDSGTKCITPTANWALDITAPGTTATAAPEPGGLGAIGFAVITWSVAWRRRWRNKSGIDQ
jgi:hypothetical protein